MSSASVATALDGADLAPKLKKPADVAAGVVAAVEERSGPELNVGPLSSKLEDVAGALDEVDEELLAAE
jgi:hypothetical protein